VPAGNCALHTLGQLIPAGVDRTIALSAPETVTVRT
jgi:hypothetical protein